jgi:hypothetical protein
MPVVLQSSDSGDVRVPAGDILILRVEAFDPAGISRVVVQCYQFSMGSTNKVKLAVGDKSILIEEALSQTAFDIPIRIPENAALGKWGVQMIEFTNGRGYKVSFYRGQGKFDDIVFDVVAAPTKEDHPLRLSSVEIAGLRRGV